MSQIVTNESEYVAPAAVPIMQLAITAEDSENQSSLDVNWICPGLSTRGDRTQSRQLCCIMKTHAFIRGNDAFGKVVLTSEGSAPPG